MGRILDFFKGNLLGRKEKDISELFDELIEEFTKLRNLLSNRRANVPGQLLEELNRFLDRNFDLFVKYRNSVYSLHHVAFALDLLIRTVNTLMERCSQEIEDRGSRVNYEETLLKIHNIAKELFDTYFARSFPN